MQKGIHPTWYSDCQVTCSCGNTFVIGSNQPTLEVDICNKCHPFFTGEVKFIDRQGRVDKFKKKMAAAQPRKAAKKSVKAADPKSYRELLREQQTQLRQETKKADEKAKTEVPTADKAKQTKAE